MNTDDLEALEVDLLLEGLQRRYGYDFRAYARSSIHRRVRRRVSEEGLDTITGLAEKVLHDQACMERLLLDFSINTTAMFRDPSFFRVFRNKVVPLLRTYPFIRIWNAGCSTGEETYSLAILLQEEGLGERSRVYATDMNAAVVERAATGAFPTSRMRDYTDNYLRSGGTGVFSEYYTANGDEARLAPGLRDNVVFAQHNLVTDRSFNEFHAILCRNVMIYFDRTLQDHVHELFYSSLVHLGVLGLGRKESFALHPRHQERYDGVDGGEKLYQKVG